MYKRQLRAFWQEADRLRDMFKFEFFYAPTEEFHQDIDAELVFYDPEWQSNINDPEYLLNMLNKLTPLVAHASLTPFIESYRIVADCFARLEPNETLDEKSCMNMAFKYGRQAYLQRRISSKASIGQNLFKNAYKLLDSYGVVDAGGNDLKQRRKQISKDLRLLSYRLERIRVLAIPNDVD